MSVDADRVRRHTAPEVLRRIDDATVASLARCAGTPDQIDRRLDELDREWDTDRALEAEAATLGLVGLALGTFARPRLLALPATARRVELHTAAALNDAIRQRADAQVLRLEAAPAEEIGKRLRVLDAEWDVERVLQANASVIVLLGLLLAASASRRFLLLPTAVFGFFAQHALQGWCPPVPVIRRLGVRTQREIERERHALKALRGDFDGIPPAGAAAVGERVRLALSAVDR